jgi:hypothetical protein
MRNFFIISKLFCIIMLFVFMRDFSRLFPASIPLASHIRSASVPVLSRLAFYGAAAGGSQTRLYKKLQPWR